jgi:hypothetical protein
VAAELLAEEERERAKAEAESKMTPRQRKASAAAAAAAAVIASAAKKMNDDAEKPRGESSTHAANKAQAAAGGSRPREAAGGSGAITPSSEEGAKRSCLTCGVEEGAAVPERDAPVRLKLCGQCKQARSRARACLPRCCYTPPPCARGSSPRPARSFLRCACLDDAACLCR